MQKMRRVDREVISIEERLAIIDKCKVCRLAMCDGDRPYVIPLNFGYEYNDGVLTLYFHGAHEGRKINILKSNNHVCFEMDGEHELTAAENDCEYGFNFASIIGFGKLEFIEDKNEKIRGLSLLMKHQTGEDREFFFEDARLNATMVCKVRVEEFTGKRRYKPQHRA
ncbi:5-nitroimidazole antibiotic resistance protein [Spirochaetia bacterium]|nr:5-nitroimidazole antibiotic resistance protein [Spirochaetia bacterium]